jgi:TRAP-type uncharacterized transport system substrate-binding protein
MTKDALFIIGDCWGILDKVRIIHMPIAMQKGALLDGTVDAICGGGMYFSEREIKVSPFAEAILAARKNAFFIGVTKEQYEKAKANVFATTLTWAPVKANALRQGFPSRDWGMLRHGITWFAWESMDEEVAYALVKTAGENARKFEEYFAAGKAAKLENFVANPWSEKKYHPGALKYYREKGITPKGTM